MPLLIIIIHSTHSTQTRSKILTHGKPPQFHQGLQLSGHQEPQLTQAPSHTKPPAFPMLVPAKGHDSHHCGNSSCIGNGSTVTLKSCPCREIEYCTKACQKQHWAAHQVTCSIAKANSDEDWMAKMDRKPGEKRPAMHGIKVVPSKCLECKRTIIVKPEVRYDNFVCRFM